MTDRVYAVITTDIVGSTEYYKTNGKPLRPLLIEVLGEVNRRHADALAVPFTITLGDEFQGLLSDPGKCPRVIHDLRLLLSPLKCRVGVGIGPIVSELMQSTAQMEGLAFSMSRDALSAAEKAKSALTVYRSEDSTLDSTANAISLLIDAVQSRWTDKQWEAVRVHSRVKDLARVGEQLGMTMQGAEHRLRSTHWREVEQGIECLSASLSQSCGNSDAGLVSRGRR